MPGGGTPELFDDERFTSTLLRAQHQQALLEIMESIFACEDAQYWLEQFRAAGVPARPSINIRMYWPMNR